MIVIGLTGSIGMGKSTTAALFGERGFPVFGADDAVHALYRSRAVPPIEAAFPGTTRNGAVDRERLAEKVIGDADAMRRLESIVHPLVREDRAAFLASAQAGGAFLAVLDVPLLFETGADSGVDVIVLASAPEAVQKSRVLARPHMTETRFAAMVAKQMPDAEKRRRAHFVIETGHGLAVARMQVAAVIAALEANKRDA